LRRQATTGRAGGSSRVERLDPFALPAHFLDIDPAADEQIRHVELHRKRVVLRRALGGIKMAVNLPITAYLGVTIRAELATSASPGAIAIVLEHPDTALSLTLCRARDGNDIVADWHSWARTLGLPLLVAQSDGALRKPFAHLGDVAIATPIARRRQRSPMRGRRASVPLRRGRGSLSQMARIHAGEREIIARN
jgi:Family of unknown function (DUF6101)